MQPQTTSANGTENWFTDLYGSDSDAKSKSKSTKSGGKKALTKIDKAIRKTERAADFTKNKAKAANSDMENKAIEALTASRKLNAKKSTSKLETSA